MWKDPRCQSRSRKLGWAFGHSRKGKERKKARPTFLTFGGLPSSEKKISALKVLFIEEALSFPVLPKHRWAWGWQLGGGSANFRFRLSEGGRGGGAKGKKEIFYMGRRRRPKKFCFVLKKDVFWPLPSASKLEGRNISCWPGGDNFLGRPRGYSPLLAHLLKLLKLAIHRVRRNVAFRPPLILRSFLTMN